MIPSDEMNSSKRTGTSRWVREFDGESSALCCKEDDKDDVVRQRKISPDRNQVMEQKLEDNKKRNKPPPPAKTFKNVTFSLFLVMGCAAYTLLNFYPDVKVAHNWNNLVRTQQFPSLQDAVKPCTKSMNTFACCDPHYESELESLYTSFQQLGLRPMTYIITVILASFGIFLVTCLTLFILYFRRREGIEDTNEQLTLMTVSDVIFYGIICLLIDLSYFGVFEETAPGVCGYFDNLNLERCFVRVGACVDFQALRGAHRATLISTLASLATFLVVSATEKDIIKAQLQELEMSSSSGQLKEH